MTASRSVPVAIVLSAFVLISTVVGAGRYASFAEVAPVLAALNDIVPPELRGDGDPASRSTAWDIWAERHDGEVRRRLDRGDEDTIVNWLLFGTSFTSRPRALFDPTVADPEPFVQLVAARARDLAGALSAPGTDERRLFARQMLERQGYGVGDPKRRAELEVHLVAEVARVAREQNRIAADLAEARKRGNATEQFAVASRVYQSRGLSLDTSILPGFAIEQALTDLRQRGLIAPGSVREAAIVGPGLDFADKNSGFDFYPPQTVQPFAVIDSLRRLNLADEGGPAGITTLDLSPRVNEHLVQARARADRGQPYVIQLPLDAGVAWRPDLVAYWSTSGERVGGVTQTAVAPGLGQDLRPRTVTVPPHTLLRIHPEDVNIVVERLPDRRFDLIVATNVFVYYDLLDQALAVSNVAAMLRPGGFLLSNNALLELPASGLRSAGYTTVQYSDRPDDGDHVVWYRRER
jgi:hypothetical protein